MKAFGIVLALLLSNGCQAAPSEKPAAVETGGETVLGSLQWEITEPATKTILGQGRREIRLKDVSFKEGNDAILKQIPLSDHFVLNLVESPSPALAEKKGFGLMLSRDDRNDVFSWDWFVVNYEDHAYKLQEGGSLRLKIAKVGTGWEVTRVEFLSDVSLRAVLVGSTNPPDDPKWRLKIFKGSVIRWPSMVNGVVVAGN